jgi:hypothetical protein
MSSSIINSNMINSGINKGSGLILNITNSITGHIDKITDEINQIPHKSNGKYILLGGIFCLLAIIIAGREIILHLHYFHKTNLQLYIVRILLMVPVSNFHY